MIVLYVLIFIISCLVLARSSAWAVKSLSRISDELGWKEFVTASILMATATSLPELFVGISSSLHQKPQLSFGNIIGSNIIALTLVMGIGTLLAKKLKFGSKTLQKSSLLTSLIASLPLFLILDNEISRLDGAILLLTSIIYFSWLLGQKRELTKSLLAKIWSRERFKKLLKHLAIFIAGISLLLLSTEGVVRSASALATELGLPLIVIGLFLVALGTSTPEIVLAIESVAQNHKRMILGGTMGSVIVNSTLILGISGLICPFKIPNLSPYLAGLIFIIITAFSFAVFAKTNKEISKKEAFVLLGLYFAFLILQIILSYTP